MKLGYPVTNLGLGITSSHTFRLANISEDQVYKTTAQNLEALEATLRWNASHGLMFYRISSGVVPFGSHPSMAYNWQEKFRDDFERIGKFIRENDFRISMHPGQFVVINSPIEAVYASSVRELEYHHQVLELLGLDRSHKIQFHLGGLYGDWETSSRIFAERYGRLHESLRQRLVIENDERMASVGDLLKLHEACGIPILFDTLHHQVKNEGETILAALKKVIKTWKPEDGVPMIDYSNQNPLKKTGAHAETLDVERFRSFIRSLKGIDIDIMFEIKNKEASALQALTVAEMSRLRTN